MTDIKKAINKADNASQAGSALSQEHLKDAVDITCDECGGTVFEEKMIIKKISKFITGAPQDTLAPIGVMVCAKCNHINDIFKPKF